MPADAQFEAIFSDLAYSHLREKAPALLPYMLGFQLLDKAEDDTKGVGVFGFKAGENMFFVPLFFINGELKGYELLYLKNQDLFVPLQDNWVNYLINKKPITLGDPAEKNLSDMGVTKPDFMAFNNKPGTKYGSVAKWVTENKSSIDRLFGKSLKTAEYTESINKFHLPNFIKSAGLPVSMVLIDRIRSDVKFAEAIFSYYDLDDIKVSSFDPQTVKRAKDVKVTVLNTGNIDNTGDITDAEKETVLIEGQAIRDNRDEKSKSIVYNTTFAKSLSNPDNSDYYKMLTRDGKYVDILYVAGPKTIGEGKSICGTVVNLDNKSVSNYDPKCIYVGKVGLEGTGYKKWTEEFKGLTSVDDIDSSAFGMILAPNKDGTLPFKVIQKTNNTDGSIDYYVIPDTEVVDRRYGSGSSGEVCGGLVANSRAKIEHRFNGSEYDHIRDSLTDGEKDSIYAAGLSPYRNIRHIHVLGSDKNRSERMVQIGTTLFVPSNHKFMSLKSPKEIKNPVVPGNMVDVDYALVKTASMSRFKIYNYDNEFQIKHDLGNTPMLNKNAAWRFLTLNMGVDASVAKDIVKTAGAERKSMLEYRIKYAQDYPGAYSGTANEYDETSTEDASIQPPGVSNTDAQNVMQAAQTGQKDVFDTTVVGNLVKAVDSGSLVDRYMKDLIRGLDRVGRILFLFYWHNDQLRERYGNEDMPDLEDSLRNVFKSFGDLVLFLKQKDLDPMPAQSATNVDLGLLV